MTSGRAWILLALAAALLMGAASAAGLFFPYVYAQETDSWAAQGRGQDAANLFCALPALLAALHFAFRGSLRAALVSLGLLVYLVYSYVLYAFFIHFGPLFPVYVATLGLGAYALGGGVIRMDRSGVAQTLAKNSNVGLVSTLLFVFALLFAGMWIAQIVPALLAGTVPSGLSEIGEPVNPIHVLDLSLLLPGMIAAAVGARRGRPLGLLFAAPLLVFSAMMGIAILCMFVAERAADPVPAATIGGVVLFSIFGVFAFLRRVAAE